MKRNFLFSTLFMVVFYALPTIAYASSSIFGLAWEPSENDKSILYLGQLFGSMSTVLEGTGNPLIGNLFKIFNIAVLILGSIVVSYTIIMATIHTAHEGEVMGKKWSSLWIPLRSAVGIAFLIPTASGYSLLQILLMNIVVYGVAAADQLWGQVVDGMLTGFANPKSTITIDQAGLQTAAERLLYSMVCASVVNTNPSCRVAVNNGNVSAYASDNTVYIGISGDSNYAHVCGGIQAGAAPDNVLSPDSWTRANITAFEAAAGSLSNLASSIAAGTTPTGQNEIFGAMNSLKGSITAVPMQPPPVTTELADAKSNGWLYAGSYYFVMINKQANLDYPPPSALPANSGDLQKLGSECVSAVTQAQGRIGTYLETTEISGIGEGSNTTLQLPRTSASPEVAQFMDAIAAPIEGLIYKLMAYLTTNDPRGPLASLGVFGADIMIVAENIWFAIILVALLLMLAGCTMSGFLSNCWMLGAIISFLVPVLNIIIMLLWSVGALLGIYMPLVPYLVFTFTALGWFLLVVETIVAAPIVALGLVSPAGEQLGKATPALTLLVNVFLRPSLMILGLVAATFLVNAAVTMVNYGFRATVEASVSGLGIFGLIALLLLYGSLVIAIIHECFSLIHVLPDNIVRWIGGHAEKSSVKDKLKEAKEGVEKGAKMGGEAMQTSADYMYKKSQKKEGGGGGTPTPGPDVLPGGGGAPGGGGGGGPPKTSK